MVKLAWKDQTRYSLPPTEELNCMERIGVIKLNNVIFPVTETSKLMAEDLTVEAILWTLAFAVECFMIIVGNAIAIAVFWKQRSKLKRTRYPLINLSAADFMVGVCAIDNIVCLPLDSQGCKIIQETEFYLTQFLPWPR